MATPKPRDEAGTATNGGPSLIYFAYGSNMLSGRLRERVPSARALCRAELRTHTLRWHKRSRDGSAKCDAFATGHPGDVVHGVLYEVARAEMAVLDRAEGLGAGYAAVEVVVHRPEHAVRALTALRALTYCATHIEPEGLPYTWYRALVVAGAREHLLPADYIDALAAAPAREDPDAARVALHTALLETP
jgi:gamma-glutamylcyclotransferase